MYLFSKYLPAKFKVKTLSISIPRVFAKSNKVLNNINNNKLYSVSVGEIISE